MRRWKILGRVMVGVTVIASIGAIPMVAGATPIVRAPLPGDASTTDPNVSLNAISCATTSQCVAAGNYTTTTSDEPGAAWSWNGKKWSDDRLPLHSASAVVPVAVLGVTCRTKSSCVAVGDVNTTGKPVPAAWTLAARRWTSAQVPLPGDSATDVPDAEIDSIACPTATTCFGGGNYVTKADSQQPAIWKLTQGRWTVIPAGVPGDARANPSSSITGISCVTTTRCVAVGGYVSSGSGVGAIWTLTGQTWKVSRAALPANAAARPASSVDVVACPASRSCVAGGTYQAADGTSQGAFWAWSGKTWRVTQARVPVGADRSPGPEIRGISCPRARSCVAAGSYDTTTGFNRAAVWVLSGSTWTAVATPVPADALQPTPGEVGPLKGGPFDALDAVSCPAARAQCVAVGDYMDNNHEQQGFFLDVAASGHGLGASSLGTTTTTQSTTTTQAPTTTSAPATTTTTQAQQSQITIASLEAALAQQANAVPPSPGQPPGSWTVTCGPPSASLAVGADILCRSFNPAIGSSEEVIRITGTSPSSFTVVAGPGSSIPCSGLDAAEQAAFTADGQSCSTSG